MLSFGSFLSATLLGLVALALAGAPAAAPPSARAPAVGIAMDADEPLQVWLLEKAGIKAKFIAKVLSSLEAEDVADVEDLRILASLPRFEKCLSELTATKIRTALGPGDAPPGVATKHMVGVASTPTPATVVATPPAATRTRQCGELPTPSTPVAAPRRLLFDSPAAVAESPEAAPSHAVLLLQAAARGMLARTGVVSGYWRRDTRNMLSLTGATTRKINSGINYVLSEFRQLSLSVRLAQLISELSSQL